MQVLTARFNRKTVNAVRFSFINIRISIIFMHSRSKLTSEMRQKVRKIGKKTRAKPYQSTVDTGYNGLSGDQKIWHVITEVRYNQHFQ